MVLADTGESHIETMRTMYARACMFTRDDSVMRDSCSLDSCLKLISNVGKSLVCLLRENYRAAEHVCSYTVEH